MTFPTAYYAIIERAARLKKRMRTVYDVSYTVISTDQSLCHWNSFKPGTTMDFWMQNHRNLLADLEYRDKAKHGQAL